MEPLRGDRPQTNGQGHVPVADQGRQRLQFPGGYRESGIGKAREQLTQDGGDFEAGEGAPRQWWTPWPKAR
ncbi:hypothetical protein GCM10015535_31940 [Streptomyces gelaticus]|uniref:Uncharacterized protein n=1 Tax=Streptomyces gelaticus TaxID=285446 RepID=A0ABQ2W0L5_9ACTN|nr:hypothetical protein GCM10015535_31940 [Streptomyces gelaticus]